VVNRDKKEILRSFVLNEMKASGKDVEQDTAFPIQKPTGYQQNCADGTMDLM
jgi:hypothetical protein